MQEYTIRLNPDLAEITGVVREIVRMLHPGAVYLYNHKRSMDGQTTSFKLCVIADCPKVSAERDIYLNIDCDVPFDVLLYTPEEWQRLAGHPDSFARKILTTGTVVYG